MQIGRFVQRIVGGCDDLFNQALRQRLRGIAVLDVHQVFNVALGSLMGEKSRPAGVKWFAMAYPSAIFSTSRWVAGSRTTPFLPTFSRPASNCGLTRQTPTASGVQMASATGRYA